MKKSLLALALATTGLVTTGAAHAQAADTLKKIKDSGVVTMGVRESSGALSYTLGDGKYTGFHYEVCQHIISNLEKVAGKKLEIKYQPVTSQNRIPLVQYGTVDIECGSTTNSAVRQKDVAFANTVYVEEVRMAVKANSGITSIAQLNGKNVATTTGTTSVQLLRKNERASGVDFKAPIRRQLVVEGYTILLSMGDQQSDLDGGSTERTFKLPNPVYYLP